MDYPFYYELIGYLASFLIVLSLTMSALIKLRITGLIGASFFAAYGILIGSIPVMVMNICIIIIHSYYLLVMYRRKEFFHLLQVPPESPYLHDFLRFYEKQICTFQPAFDFKADPNWVPIFILRDMVTAGLILGTKQDNNRFRVELDFAIPKYRDFKIARYLFQRRLDFFYVMGIKAIESPKGNKIHNDYLERIGFKASPDAPNHYVLVL